MDTLREPLSLQLLARGLVPDVLIRHGIRRLLRDRLREEERGGPEERQAHLSRFIDQLRHSPVAIHTAEANQQHYELPTAFFQRVMGRHMKYSSCLFDLAAPPPAREAYRQLDEAEARMLALTAGRAGLQDGDRILELGCGWGSLSLWMAAHFPASRITVVSNSRTQKQYIDAQAAARGLGNLEVITCDMNALDFPAGTRFDRVVSVEMFEHMRNYELLLRRIAGWMAPGATLFVHIFTHREFAYPFEVRDHSDWMAKYFFTGGIMPSDHLLHCFQDDLRLQQHWAVDGRHYQLTAEAWLSNMDRHRAELMPVFEATYGADQALRWWVYWRVFFMACAELWGFRGGREWIVSHYLFSKPAT
ncbi:MAG: Cyclopropane-fatty-acyl-phospholipid synthase [Pseudomonadota bacterium]|jgi:cyclopropane-fatty-acyl-phospholipid synthase